MLSYWIVFGIIAGILAFFIDSKQSKGGLLGSVLVGVVGAIVGGNLANIIFEGGIRGFDIQGLVAMAVGTALLLYIRRTIYNL